MSEMSQLVVLKRSELLVLPEFGARKENMGHWRREGPPTALRPQLHRQPSSFSTTEHLELIATICALLFFDLEASDIVIASSR
jgi:hypothetical protein